MKNTRHFRGEGGGFWSKQNYNVSEDDREGSENNDFTLNPIVILNAEIHVAVTEDGKFNCFVIDTFKQLPVNFDELKNETGKDDTMKILTNLINDGWPRQQKQIQDDEVARFFVHHDSLIVIRSCVF